MPSEAEFDPILENADSKLKGFLATLTEFRVEAAAMDQERLDMATVRASALPFRSLFGT